MSACSGGNNDRLDAAAAKIRSLSSGNKNEVDGVLRALSGEFILPEASGDLL